MAPSKGWNQIAVFFTPWCDQRDGFASHFLEIESLLLVAIWLTNRFHPVYNQRKGTILHLIFMALPSTKGIRS